MLLRTVFAAILMAGSATASGVLDRLAETGALRIGVRTDTAPLSYFDAETGQARGYTVALCERLAERLANQVDLPEIIVQPVPVTAADRFDAIASGRVDLLCGAASVTIARRALVDFSLPVYIDGASVLMRQGETRDFDMLANRRIGVRGGTTTERSLLATLERAGMIADVVILDAHAEGVARLLGRDIDAYFADQSILLYLMESSGRAAELAVARNVLSVEPQALALPLGDTAFRLEVDRALSRMYRSGELAEIFSESFAPATMGDAMKALMITAPLPE